METLSHATLETLYALRETKTAVEGYNDYGDFTGFRQEIDDIETDFQQAMNSLTLRAYRLRYRVSKFEEQNKAKT